MQGMSLIVKRITRYTVGLIFMYGVYIVLHGHLTPGGGFAGGIIIALSFIHLVLAFGADEAKKNIPQGIIRIGESLGGMFFLGIALIGIFSGFFFVNFLSTTGTPFSIFSGGTIPLCNIAIGLKVGTGLFAIFMALSVFRLAKQEDRK